MHVDDRHARRVAALGLDRDVAVVAAEQARVDQPRDGGRVVDRGMGHAEDVAVGRLEEPQQAEHRGGERRAECLDPGLHLGRRADLVRQVERDDRQRDAAGDDRGGGLGIDEGVELGGGRDVAEGDRAAHPDDLARLAALCQRRRDVGQRAGRDQDRLGRQLVGDQSQRAARVGADDGVGQLGAVDARHAVDVGRDHQLARQRAVGAGGHRHVGAAGQRQHAARVLGRARERLVAGHRRDRHQVDRRVAEREQHRDGVVVAGVAVEDDAGAHA